MEKRLPAGGQKSVGLETVMNEFVRGQIFTEGVRRRFTKFEGLRFFTLKNTVITVITGGSSSGDVPDTACFCRNQ